MRHWLVVGVLCASSGAWAQQGASSGGSPSPAGPPSSGTPASDPSSPQSQPSGSASSKQEQGGANSSAPLKQAAPDLTPPRSDRVRTQDLGDDVGESSSKDTQVDLSAPDDDAKKHPESASVLEDMRVEAAGAGGADVQEFHAWDPHKAAKDVEIGDFYFKRKNYRAAEERYREALQYKDNDALATFRLATCLEQLGQRGSARDSYASYLKIVPHGEFSLLAQKAVERLKDAK